MNNIKRTTLIIAMALLPAACFGWGRLGHSSIAQIAQDHLTPKARAAIAQYLDGESLATFASIPDDYRKQLDRMGLVAAHTYSVDENRDPYRVKELGDRKIVNCLMDIDRFAGDLYRNARTMNDTIRACEIIILVHIVGDMHCPGHVRYAPELDAGYYDIKYGGDDVYFHGLMDDGIISKPYPWSFSDIARICDVSSEKQIRGIVAGDQYAWGREHALESVEMRSVKPGGQVDWKWINDQAPLTRRCIRNAGYRLAHVLNTVFDPSYARRRGRDLLASFGSAR